MASLCICVLVVWRSYPASYATLAQPPRFTLIEWTVCFCSIRIIHIHTENYIYYIFFSNPQKVTIFIFVQTNFLTHSYQYTFVFSSFLLYLNASCSFFKYFYIIYNHGPDVVKCILSKWFFIVDEYNVYPKSINIISVVPFYPPCVTYKL